MNAESKKFIENKLIPFILREKGQGFVMDRTIYKSTAGEHLEGDGIDHIIPSCNTVACIYGSIEVLQQKYIGVRKAADILGITPKAAYGLFYSWTVGNHERFRWPTKHAKAFAKAKTPLAKAKVAVSLLREVVRTNGKIMKAK